MFEHIFVFNMDVKWNGADSMRGAWIVAAGILGFFGLALSSCGGIEMRPSDPLNGSAWLLVSLEERAPIPGVEITADFDVGSVHGSSGCNSFRGSYQVNGDRIEFREIGSTLMACLVPEGAMDQEQKFVALLSSSESFQIVDGQLQLFRSGRTLLKFVPRD